MRKFRFTVETHYYDNSPLSHTIILIVSSATLRLLLLLCYFRISFKLFLYSFLKLLTVYFFSSTIHRVRKLKKKEKKFYWNIFYTTKKCDWIHCYFQRVKSLKSHSPTNTLKYVWSVCSVSLSNNTIECYLISCNPHSKLHCNCIHYREALGTPSVEPFTA